MRKVSITLAFSCFLFLSAFAQNYNSVDELAGDWHTASSWVSSIAGSSNGTTTSLSEKNSIITIDGSITLNEHLSISGNNATLTISSYDTLVVNGDLSTTGKGNIAVSSNAVLIVTGNANFGGNADLENNATIIVFGNFTKGGSSSISDNSGSNEGIYVFGTSSDPTLTKTEAEAQSDQPDLYTEYVGPLPIELQTFTARTSKSSVLFSWTTASEENFDFFTIERAGPNLNFQAIGTQPGQGFSTNPIDYHFIDKNPLAGVSYYRLKATDLDGTVEYHPVIGVRFTGTANTRVYPNPVTDRHLTIKGNATQLQILDLAGNTVYLQSVQPGIQTIYLPEQIKPGTYVALLDHPDQSQERRSLIIR